MKKLNGVVFEANFMKPRKVGIAINAICETNAAGMSGLEYAPISKHASQAFTFSASISKSLKSSTARNRSNFAKNDPRR